MEEKINGLDMEVQQELEQEAAAKVLKKKQRGKTALAGLCGCLSVLVVMLGIAMLFQGVPAILFVAGPLAVWGFNKLFHGGTGKAYRVTIGIVAFLVFYIGTAIDGAGIFTLVNGIPVVLVPYATLLVMTSSWMFSIAGSGMLYTFLFSLVGFIVAWELTGNFFQSRRGVKNAEKTAEAEEEDDANLYEPEEAAEAETEE